MTSVNRNVSFFTTGYNWMIQIIPALIMAPAFINKEIEFGVISQSAMAFATLVAAFSLIITQYQSISNFSAVVARLNSLLGALERKQPAADSGIELSREDGRVAYEQLNLLSPQDGHSLLENLSISIPFGSRVLISGSNEAAKVALFRATAGLSTSGGGRFLFAQAPKTCSSWPSDPICRRVRCAMSSCAKDVNIRYPMSKSRACCTNSISIRFWSERAD